MTLSLAKELRALLPMWAAVMAVMLADALAGSGRLNEIGLLAYALGSLALGAHAIGHEHSHRTLAVLLAQPIDRRKILVTKLAVLAPMLFAMGALAWYEVAGVLRPPALALILLPALGGLTVAPLLTMLTRNQLGGVMLTGMIGGWSMITTSVLTVRLSGLPAREAEQLALLIWALEMCAVGLFAAMLAWRTFMRLEVIEGAAGRDLQLPRWFHATHAGRGRRPVSMLIRKELRLQQMTFVIAGIFVAMWVYLFVRSGAPEHEIKPILEALSAIYLVAVAMTAGALASAEERQSGMLEAQQLLPMAGWQQWMIKTGVVLAVALLLGIGPPAFLIYAAGAGAWLRGVLPPPAVGALLILVVTASSLYVSSLATSGVRALTLAFPFVLGTYIFAAFVARSVPTSSEAVFVTTFLFAGLLLVFAAANHRRSDRTVTRVLLQIGAAAALIAVSLPAF